MYCETFSSFISTKYNKKRNPIAIEEIGRSIIAMEMGESTKRRLNNGFREEDILIKMIYSDRNHFLKHPISKFFFVSNLIEIWFEILAWVCEVFLINLIFFKRFFALLDFSLLKWCFGNIFEQIWRAFRSSLADSLSISLNIQTFSFLNKL